MARARAMKKSGPGKQDLPPPPLTPSAGEGGEGAWFGYKPVDPAEKTQRVGAVFHRVAPRYDLMNDLMSGGIHRLWKRRFAQAVRLHPGERVLDVAGGTGDIARLLRRGCPRADITLCDINESMVRVGRDRALDRGDVGGIRYAVGNAEHLPFATGSMDVYTIAFGLRNVTDIDAALRDAARVLKPGGRFLCLEFSQVVLAPLRPLYDAYSFGILPFLGRHVAGDADAYRYLAESIRKFPPQDALAQRMEQAGLSHVTYTNLSGGIAAIHTGYKPAGGEGCA